MAAGFIVLCVLLLLPTVVLGFEVDNGTSLNHQEITKRAFLNITVQVCRAIAQSEGRVFTPPVSTLYQGYMLIQILPLDLWFHCKSYRMYRKNIMLEQYLYTCNQDHLNCNSLFKLF